MLIFVGVLGNKVLVQSRGVSQCLGSFKRWLNTSTAVCSDARSDQTGNGYSRWEASQFPGHPAVNNSFPE